MAETKSVRVSIEVWKRLMNLKVEWGAKDLDEVVRRLLDAWKTYGT